MCVCVLIGLAAGEAHSEVAWEQVERKKRGEVGLGICPEALEAKKGSRKKPKGVGGLPPQDHSASRCPYL